MKIERDLGNGYVIVRIGDKYSVMGQPFKREWFDSLAACLLAWEINKPVNVTYSLTEQSLNDVVNAMLYAVQNQPGKLCVKPTKILVCPNNEGMSKLFKRLEEGT